MATTVYRYFGGVIEKIAQPDASILYGDLIFTTFRAFGSLIPWWEHHLERLRRGAIFLASHRGRECAAWDLMRQSLEDARLKFLQHFQDQQWIGRPTLKRQGEGLQLMFFAWEVPVLQSTGQKLAVALSERKRDLPAEVKGGGYVSENEGRQWAINQGMDDILFWQGSQMISESSTSNIFFISRNGEILTPTTSGGSCLAGIAREQVMALVKRLGLQLREREIFLSELEQMQEAFLTNCGQLIRPVSQINDYFLSSSHDNSLTNKLKKELNFK